MTEEQPQQKKKKPVGGINAYRTFGSPNDQQSEHADASTAERPDFQQSSSPEVQQPTSAGVQTSIIPKVQRSKHPDWKQQTVYLPPARIKWLKHYAVQTETEISEIMNLALKEYQERHT
jgi:hypothetical protein